MLKTVDLCFERDNQVLFENVNLDLQAGKVVTFTGNNGVGKTTLLKIFCGLVHPTFGAILWHGKSIYKRLSCYVSQLLYVGHENGLAPNMTVAENLCFLAGMEDVHLSSRDIHLSLSYLGLAPQADTFVAQLSAGQKRRVALARLWHLQHKKIWILDEPFTTLDQHTIELLEAEIADFVKQGGLVLISSHQPVNLPASLLMSVRLSNILDIAA